MTEAQTVRPSRETIGERRLIHGHTVDRSTTPTYRSWMSMRNRCLNKKTALYQRYGARGIEVCPRWESFVNFLADMGERPCGTSLDRYPDRNGHYEPNNCRWATHSQQCRNRSTSRPVMRSDGRHFESMAEAAEATGGNRQCIRDVCVGRQKTHQGYSWRFTDE